MNRELIAMWIGELSAQVDMLKSLCYKPHTDEYDDMTDNLLSSIKCQCESVRNYMERNNGND